MPQFIIGSEADIAAIEHVCWCYNWRHVYTTYADGLYAGAPIGGISDQDLLDRESYPLHAIGSEYDEDGNPTGGAVVLWDTPTTLRWDVPHAVTNEASPYYGEYAMALPAVNSPYDEATTERLLSLWHSVSSSFPGVEVVEVDPADLFAPVDEG